MKLTQKISTHFDLSEFTQSDKAVKLQIDNTPEDWHIENLKELAINVLEPLREYVGAIRISSGYRSLELNKAVGGSSTSQHCTGQAVDISFSFMDKYKFAWIIDNIDYDQLIWEYGDDNKPAWIHISYVSKKANRKQTLRKYYGKSTYNKIEKIW